MKDLITRRDLFTAVFVGVFILFAAYILVLGAIYFSGGVYVEKSAQLGDTIGGLLGPIIGGVGALLTFLAFYVQYQANQDTKEQFRIQYQNSLEAGFETSFFARLELFKKVQKEVEDSMAFKGLLDDYTVVYCELGKFMENIYLNTDPSIQIAHFEGVTSVSMPNWNVLWSSKWSQASMHHFVFAILERGSDKFDSFPFINNTTVEVDLYSYRNFLGYFLLLIGMNNIEKSTMWAPNVDHDEVVIKGNASFTNQYILNLYDLICFVIDTTVFDNMAVHSDQKSTISKAELLASSIKKKKGDYFSLVRAQMSSYETVFVYYNAISDNGVKWCDSQIVNGVSRSIVRDYDLFKNLNEDLVLPQNRIENLPDQLRQYFHVDQGGTWEGE